MIWSILILGRHQPWNILYDDYPSGAPVIIWTFGGVRFPQFYLFLYCRLYCFILWFVFSSIFVVIKLPLTYLLWFLPKIFHYLYLYKKNSLRHRSLLDRTRNLTQDSLQVSQSFIIKFHWNVKYWPFSIRNCNNTINKFYWKGGSSKFLLLVVERLQPKKGQKSPFNHIFKRNNIPTDKM